MKKSLIAMAVLAASGTAMAQSSVTLYGVADVFFAQVGSGVGAANLKQTRIQSGGMNGSRWGLRGAEDLGGGLKANFTLESGFTLDDGNVANGATMFGRQAFVGLSGGFGEVTFGRQYSAYDGLRGATNNTFDTAVATTGAAWGVGVADYTGRINNSVMYTSPNMSGFTAAAMIGLGENKTATNDATQTTSLRLQYASGPVLVGLAHQVEQAQAAGSNTDTTYTLIAGSYNFGVATVLAGFNTAKTGNSEDKEFQFGLNFPVGKQSVIGFGYTNQKGDVAGTKTTSASGMSLAAAYNLSSRTAMYAGWNKQTAKNEVTGADTADNSLLAVGIRHKF